MLKNHKFYYMCDINNKSQIKFTSNIYPIH